MMATLEAMESNRKKTTARQVARNCQVFGVTSYPGSPT
jgi:hypothetical protein